MAGRGELGHNRGMATLVETAPLSIEDLDFRDEAAMDAFHEAWIESGRAKLLDDFRRLREMGIIDEFGNQLKTVIMPDMLDETADFGG